MKHAAHLPPRPRTRPGRKTRTAALLGGATAITLMVAACSSGSDDASAPSTGDNEPAPSATAEVTPSETSDAAATNER